MSDTAGLLLWEVHKETVCLLFGFTNLRAFLGNPNGFMDLKLYFCRAGDQQEHPGQLRGECSPWVGGLWGRWVLPFLIYLSGLLGTPVAVLPPALCCGTTAACTNGF